MRSSYGVLPMSPESIAEAVTSFMQLLELDRLNMHAWHGVTREENLEIARFIVVDRTSVHDFGSSDWLLLEK
jgi:hypothetical protein